MDNKNFWSSDYNLYLIRKNFPSNSNKNTLTRYRGKKFFPLKITLNYYFLTSIYLHVTIVDLQKISGCWRLHILYGSISGGREKNFFFGTSLFWNGERTSEVFICVLGPEYRRAFGTEHEAQHRETRWRKIS